MPGFSRRLLLPAGAAWLASCASAPPALYTLDAPPGPVRRGGPKTIEIRTIGLARYLERSQIVRSSENFRVEVLANDWWAEPLEAMIGRVLARALAQRLPGSTVFTENGAISAEPAATVQVNIQRLDQDASQAILLLAQFAIVRQPPDTRAVSLSVPPRGLGTAGLVAAMSEAVGLLADRIAAAVAVG